MEIPESVKSALRTLDTETQGLVALKQAIQGDLANDFVKAVKILSETG